MVGAGWVVSRLLRLHACRPGAQRVAPTFGYQALIGLHIMPTAFFVEKVMGEAKRRRQSEANFGRVPKGANHRGLVVCPPIEINGSRLEVKSSNLDPLELRFALLFWDRLVWPSSHALHFASNPDETFLESASILARPDYTVYGDVARGIAIGQIQAYEDLEFAEPGVWCLAQGENSFLWKEGLADEGKGALVELHRAIPIPQQDVPLAEILEFRLRRHDELVLLRYQLESFVAEIDQADDKTAVLEKRLADIDQACANLLAVGKEWQFPVHVSNIKASFNFGPIKTGAATWGGWEVGKQFGLAAAASIATAAGVASMLEIKGDFGLRSARRAASPYRYAYQIGNELI